MKNIGLQLKTAREAKKLTLQEVCDQTKITVRRLQAIEEGDIEYFGDDISYLRYYVRLYATSLGLDYEPIKDELQKALDDYDDLTKTNIIIEKKQLENRINEKAEIHKKEHHKVDVPFISMILAIVALVFILLFVMIKFVHPSEWFSHSTTPDTSVDVVDPYISDTQENENQTGEQTNEPVVEKAVVTLSRTNDTTFALTGWKSDQPVSIRYEIGKTTTMVHFYLNGAITNNPAAMEYGSGKVVELLYYPQLNDQITLHVGRMATNKLYINDEEVVIDGKYADWEKGLHLYFNFE